MEYCKIGSTEKGRLNLKRVEKPWGYELWWAFTDKYVGKIIHVYKDHSLSYQYHELKDETIYVYSGEVIMEIEEAGRKRESLRLLPGDAIRIVPLTRHRLTALEESELLEVSTPEVDDLIRLEDRYGRI